jgi:mercuric ion transport protein
MTPSIKRNSGWVSGLLAAFATSLCYITPALALLGGISGLTSSFSWVEPLRPYLIGFTFIAFGFAWLQKLKPQKQVDCDCIADNKKSFWQSNSFLGIVTAVAGLLITFPYYAKAFLFKTTRNQNCSGEQNKYSASRF